MDFKTEQPIRQQKNIRAAWQPSRPTLYKHEKHYEKAPERKTGGVPEEDTGSLCLQGEGEETGKNFQSEVERSVHTGP